MKVKGFIFNDTNFTVKGIYYRSSLSEFKMLDEVMIKSDLSTLFQKKKIDNKGPNCGSKLTI